jgi:iron complex outermembrane receptor protein
VNVPATSLKLQGVYNVRTVPSLALLGFVTHEGERMVLPDNRLATPGWTRLDLSARWTQKAPGRNLVWRAGLDNVTDARAWKEAPLQFGHLYLYPLASRTLRLSLTAAL